VGHIGTAQVTNGRERELKLLSVILIRSQMNVRLAVLIMHTPNPYTTIETYLTSTYIK
jgi:hypothetical protein